MRVFSCLPWGASYVNGIFAEAVAERLGKRQGGDRKTDQSGNISTLIDHGKTRDLAAAKAGLGSGKTLEAAQ